MSVRLDIGDGLAVRPVRATDAEELYAVALANREHLRPWMPWAIDLRPATSEAFVRSALAQEARDDGFQGVVERRGTIVGVAGFHRVDQGNRATSVGYWIAARHQGRGVATRAVGALVGHAFDELGLHRVELAARHDNHRSRAVAERLGFRLEGVRRGGERHGEAFHDLAVYGLLASDPRL